jgi:hypothetical protein
MSQRIPPSAVESVQHRFCGIVVFLTALALVVFAIWKIAAHVLMIVSPHSI